MTPPPNHGKVSLKLPHALLDAIKPTGIRTCREQEAAWLLDAALDVMRGLGDSGVLGVVDDVSSVYPGGNDRDTKIPLKSDNLVYLNQVSEVEHASRAELARRLLAMALKVRAELPRNSSYGHLAEAIGHEIERLKTSA